jgi:hypothetical protein
MMKRRALETLASKDFLQTMAPVRWRKIRKRSFLCVPWQEDGYMLWRPIIFYTIGPFVLVKRCSLTVRNERWFGMRPGRRVFLSAYAAIEWGWRI